ncbi:MAG TPA: hypothetical protein VEW03_14240 [Longimicrobiaceae bacterium]|nr:hypothetical protein [Longimicrobiaceae bacterium]
MRRVVVLGGTGFFGASAARLLRQRGITPVLASRHPPSGLRVDAEDPASLRGALRPGDVVLDAAGPFQRRTPALVEAAMDVGFDLVDLADSLAYVRAVLARFDAVRSAGIRVLPACSSVSAVSAALVAWSGVARPVRLSGFLVPSSRRMRGAATAAALLGSVGAPVEVLRGGRLVRRRGLEETAGFPSGTPLGRVRGRLFETPDPALLPASHPTLRDVAWYVDVNVPGLGALLGLAARRPAVRAAVERLLAPGMVVARALGRPRGGVACEVEGQDGEVARLALSSRADAFLTAVVPATLACESLARGAHEGCGVLPPHLQVDPRQLLHRLEELGIHLTRCWA